MLCSSRKSQNVEATEASQQIIQTKRGISFQVLQFSSPSGTCKDSPHSFIQIFELDVCVQVPKGWDRLFLSLLSAETGKTIAKFGKALVKNGSCHWSETVSESIYISRYDSSKSYEDCLLKIVVSTVQFNISFDVFGK